MALDPTREPFIPLRKAELVELLCAEAGLAAEERTAFQYFCRLLEATFHYEFNRHLQELKAAYAPFDPDTDMQALFKLGFEEKQKRLNDLFSDFGWLLDRANFRHLNRQDIEPALHGGSDWGVHLDTDFGVFDRLAMFARGDIRKTVSRRRWQNFYRLEKIDQEVYQRFVLILKLKPHRRLGRDVDTTSVYLKIFKDIPKLDIKMLLPGSRVRLPSLTREKSACPS